MNKLYFVEKESTSGELIKYHVNELDENPKYDKKTLQFFKIGELIQLKTSKKLMRIDHFEFNEKENSINIICKENITTANFTPVYVGVYTIIDIEKIINV